MKQSSSPDTPDENLVFGFDVGIASCGWAVIDKTESQERILAIGAHCFEKPEKDKTNELLNVHRRAMRGQRRVIKRRASRVRQVRQLIRSHLLQDFPLDSRQARDYYQKIERQVRDSLNRILGPAGAGKKRETDVLPWLLRREGLRRELTNEEMALVLVHLAKRRGFKSNSKSDKEQSDGADEKEGASAEGKKAAEKGKMLSAIGDNEAKMRQYRSFGDFVMIDPQFAERKRNRKDVYTHTPMRGWIADEAQKIFDFQKAKGAQWATAEFADEFTRIAFSQKGLQGSEGLVGMCPFEKAEKRAARHAPSFELFRVLQKLAHETVEMDDMSMPRRLTAAERQRVADQIGLRRFITWAALKGLLGLAAECRFKGAPDAKTEKKNNITGNSQGEFPGSYALRNTLGADTWDNLWKNKPETLDKMAAILSFNEDLDDIKAKLNALAETQEPKAFDLGKVMQACEDGKFAAFKGAGHISAKAARNINRHLVREGMVYSDACKAAGYNHDAVELPEIDDIKNATVQRAVRKALKQASVLRREFGVPGRIHVELLRDVGKSAEERGEIKSGIDKITAERKRLKKEFAEENDMQVAQVTPVNVEMLAMLKEQKYECAFCATSLRPNQLIGGHVNFAHVYPRSAFPDNSFNARVLACATCNQRQGSRTPWEWHKQGGFPSQWEVFAERVKRFNCKKEKKRRLLDKNFRQRLADDPQFANRHKVDSGFIARTVMNLLKEKFYPDAHSGGQVNKGEERRVLARPGPLTAVLRRAWLQEVYKKSRDDDRHHAMDALVVACTDEAMLQRLTRAWQKQEQEGRYQWTPNLASPWKGFTKQAMDAYEDSGTGRWHVCRTETRRVRGALHAETFRRKRKGENVFLARREVADKEFTAQSLAKMPDPNANWPLIERLAGWLLAGKPATTNDLNTQNIGEAKDKSPDLMKKLAETMQVGDVVKKRWQSPRIAESIVAVLRQWQGMPPAGAEPKPVTAIYASDLDKLQSSADQATKANLVEWLARSQKQRKEEPPVNTKGEAIENVPVLAYRRLPLSLKGDTIRRVRVITGTKTARQIHGRDMGGKKNRKSEGGFVENANSSIVRTDVFRVAEDFTNPDGKRVTSGYYLVPVYNWQILDPDCATPRRAIFERRNKDDWPLMREDDFLFSLYPGSWVEIIDADGVVTEGYYRGVDSNGGKLSVSPASKRGELMGKRVKTVRAVAKHTVDLLGKKHLVGREKYPGSHEKRRKSRAS